MEKEISGRLVAKNIAMSVIVQAISMVIGFIVNLVVPKFLNPYDYSYWQTFLLYAQYVGLLHFGLIDGIVLRYSQYDYLELDKKSIRSQYYIIMSIDFFLALILSTCGFFYFNGVIRILCVLLSVTIFSEITYNYVLVALQITNRINKYAIYVIVYRCIYCLLILVILFFGFGEFYWYCIAYILADFLGVIIIGLRYNKELFIGSLLPFNKVFLELKKTLSSGIKLTIASYSANLVVGLGKMIIQWKWDALIFGKISLAYSLTNFVLQFVTAISVVLFPSLKRMSPKRLPSMYLNIRNSISPLLIFVMMLYFPGCYLLELWLPKYVDSITYLGILFPIIFFTSKVSLLTNNYLNAYRKEKELLRINICTVIISFFVFIIISNFFHSLTLFLIAVVVAIACRSIVSEFVIMKIININVKSDIFIEIIICSIFIVCTILPNRIEGQIIYLIALLSYFFIKRKNIISLFQTIKTKIKKERGTI